MGIQPGQGETIDDARNAPQGPSTRVSPLLVVAIDCDRPTDGAARYALDGLTLLTIGRGETRAIDRHTNAEKRGSLSLPGQAVSRSHARLIRVGSEWAIEDLGSRNGVFVNGVRRERAVVGPDDIIEIGRTLMYVEADALLPGAGSGDLELAGDTAGHVTLHAELAMQLEAVKRIATSRVPLLILGETGTGKEVLARRAHDLSRRGGRFVPVNCGALPPSMVEAALFGHVRGAFTSAVRDELGFVRAADEGTLFLDEVGELPKAAQAALLRVLQDGDVVPVGTTVSHPVDLRMVAATNVSVENAVERGEFRRDLLARLAGHTIELPRLAERRRDVGVLVSALLRRSARDPFAVRFTPDAARSLLVYAWPNNIRELDQALNAALALTPTATIDVSSLPSALAAHGDLGQTRGATLEGVTPSAPSRWSPRDEALRLELLALLSKHNGSVSDVARAMGKARTQIHRWIRRFDIDPDAYRSWRYCGKSEPTAVC